MNGERQRAHVLVSRTHAFKHLIWLHVSTLGLLSRAHEYETTELIEDDEDLGIVCTIVLERNNAKRSH